MKRVVIAAAAFALLASPVLAQQGGPSKTSPQKRETTGAQTAPRLFTGPGVIRGNDVYDCRGKYLGADPDPSIRAQLLRQGEPSCGAQ